MADRDWILIFVLGMGWGASFSFNEVLLRELGPISVSAVRVGVGALGCWAYILLSGRKANIPNLAKRQTAVLGLLMFGLPFAIYPIGQQFVASGVAGIVNAMTPVMVVIVSHFWRGGERATPLKIVGVLAGLAGIVLLAWPALQSGESSRLFGVLFLVLAPVCYGFATNYAGRLREIDPVSMLAWALTWAGIGIGALALTVEGTPMVTRVETWAAMLVLGLVLTSAAFILFFHVLPRAGPTKTSTITFIAPISALLIGWGILGENIGLPHLLGMAAIFTGLLLIDGRLFTRPRTVN